MVHKRRGERERTNAWTLLETHVTSHWNPFCTVFHARTSVCSLTSLLHVIIGIYNTIARDPSRTHTLNAARSTVLFREQHHECISHATANEPVSVREINAI